ncbi:MFS transporter [Ectobacillus antri]|uniref:MFS transporter n=1 Tax=Ectobacillus antri TaxID=2486280 RepID=A0ABT6H5H4_9BACI|nr:MFS transporter [Ectobacillus antri]MDG4657118.1 MFS transporter [Ectobacillus antri]MDG5754577.1 MFS transporter [Ectobacillus antri]
MAFAINPFLSERDRQIFRRERRLFLIAVSSGTLLNPLNSSMISMALHGIQETFHLTFAAASWVISAFYLASAIGQPVMGRLGDVFGRKAVFLTGLLIAFIPAITAPIISSFAALVILRIIQAIGTSAIYPSGMGLVRAHIHYKQGYALAVISIFSSVTVALGPTVGGFVIALGDWPAIFMINIPFLLVSFLLAWFMFPKETHERHSLREVAHFLDIPGILLFAATLITLLIFVLSLKAEPQYVMGLVGVVTLLLFIRHEWKTEAAFIPLRMFYENRLLTYVNFTFVLLNIYNYVLLFGVPVYLQDHLHLSLSMSGLLMLFIAGSGIVVTPITGRWTDKVGAAPALMLGAGFMLTGAVLLAFVFTKLPVYGTIPVLLLLGMGYGFQNISLQSAMLKAAPPEQTGVASGLFQTARYIGAIFASVLLGSLFGQEVTASHMRMLSIILIGLAFASIWMSRKLRHL